MTCMYVCRAYLEREQAVEGPEAEALRVLGQAAAQEAVRVLQGVLWPMLFCVLGHPCLCILQGVPFARPAIALHGLVGAWGLVRVLMRRGLVRLRTAVTDEAS